MASTALLIRETDTSDHARNFLTSRTHCKLFPSLKDLTAKCIWESRHLFVAVKTTNMLDILPNSLKTYLLAKCSRFYNLGIGFQDSGSIETDEVMRISRQMLGLLFNKEVVSFNFCSYPVEDKKRYVDDQVAHPFGHDLTTQCPKLQKCVLNNYHKEYVDENYWDKTFLMRMNNLQVLEMVGLSFHEYELQLVAENMPNLRVLEVELLAALPQHVFKKLSTLQNLQEFIFSHWKCGQTHCSRDCYWKNGKIISDGCDDTKNLMNCMRHMPQLRIAGQRLLHENRHFLDYEKIAYISFLGLMAIKTPSILGLQELTTISLGDGIEMPNLTSLHLTCMHFTFQCDSRMSKVSELGLFEVKNDMCVKILAEIGRQLKILRLDVKDCLQVDVILQLCPNLEHLSLVRGPSFFTLASRVHPETILRLKILEIRFKRYDDFILDPMVLLQLLQAPELRRLAICCNERNEWPLWSEIAEIVTALEQHRILQKLKVVCLEGTGSTKSMLFDLMSEHCPNLIDVSSKYGESMLDNWWNSKKAITMEHN